MCPDPNVGSVKMDNRAIPCTDPARMPDNVRLFIHKLGLYAAAAPWTALCPVAVSAFRLRPGGIVAYCSGVPLLAEPLPPLKYNVGGKGTNLYRS